jgi:hypothetical protein
MLSDKQRHKPCHEYYILINKLRLSIILRVLEKDTGIIFISCVK